MSIINCKEMIEYAKRIDTSKDSSSFNEFATKYLQTMSKEHRTDSKEFLNMIKAINQKSSILPVSYIIALGKIGDIDIALVQSWCNSILNISELNTLSVDELHYVFGYAARLSKISGEKTKDNKKPDDNNRTPSDKREFKAPQKEESTVYACPSCKKDVDFGKTLNCGLKQPCPLCGRKVTFKR